MKQFDLKAAKEYIGILECRIIKVANLEEKWEKDFTYKVYNFFKQFESYLSDETYKKLIDCQYDMERAINEELYDLKRELKKEQLLIKEAFEDEKEGLVEIINKD